MNFIKDSNPSDFSFSTLRVRFSQARAWCHLVLIASWLRPRQIQMIIQGHLRPVVKEGLDKVVVKCTWLSCERFPQYNLCAFLDDDKNGLFFSLKFYFLFVFYSIIWKNWLASAHGCQVNNFSSIEFIILKKGHIFGSKRKVFNLLMLGWAQRLGHWQLLYWTLSASESADHQTRIISFIIIIIVIIIILLQD